VLPYSPLFHHWADAYDYLNPYELHRGGKVFWREEKSSIRIGADHQRYSSKKHFI
jgi:chitinase